MENPFREILKGKVIIIGIGNPLRGDDAAGVVLAGRLEGNVRALCIDAGTAPENYLGKIAKEKPDTVLFADAVHLERSPGEYEILKSRDILRTGFTTHDISPALLIDYLERETSAGIFLLGIQPEDLAFGSEMTGPVSRSVTELETMIKECLHA